MLHAAATGLFHVSSSTILVSQCLPTAPDRDEDTQYAVLQVWTRRKGEKKGKLRYKVWVLACVAGWWMGVCVCPAVVKFGLIIHVEAVTLLPKLANETPSCLGTHTGHSDQLLNENAQVSNAALARALLQIPSVHRHSYKTECTTAFFQLLGKVCHLCSLRTHQTFKWLSQL